MNYVTHFLRTIIYLALDVVIAQDDDKNDGEVLLRKIVYDGTNAVKYEQMYTFTAPIRLCERQPCGAQDDLKLVFPLFVGLDGRGSFSNGPYKPEATPDSSGKGGDKGASYLDKNDGLSKTTPMYLLFNNTCDDKGKGNDGGKGDGGNKDDQGGRTKSTKTVTLGDGGDGGGGNSKSTKTFLLGDNGKKKLREGSEIKVDDISYDDNDGNNMNYELNFGKIRNINHHTSNYYKFRPVKDFK